MSKNDFQKRAVQLDHNDPLRHFQNNFINKDSRVIYLDGNSLGRLPAKTVDILENTIHAQWGDRLIRSWNENWMGLTQRISQKIARLIGADPDEIFVGDSTSLNLYKLAYGALSLSRNKRSVVTDALNFPSDLYILEGIVANHFPSMHIQLVKSRNGMDVSLEAMEEQISDDTALMTHSHVTFKSAFMFPMKEVTELAHRYGAYVLWDLSHAAGAVPINVKDANIDLAVGCTYKYLNGGPGAPAFCYVKKELQDKIKNPIWGWFGHSKPFQFETSYRSRNTIDQLAVGTPGILSLAAVEPGVDCLLEAGMINIRKKSMDQSRFFIELFDAWLAEEGFRLGSPRDETKRGSHISIQHPEGYRINRAMIEPKDDSEIIIPDFRPPDNIRLGIAPLYTTYEDLYKTAIRMRQIVQEKIYEDYSSDPLTVT